MAPEQERLAQIFIWRQAGAPDVEYARQVLSVVNPDAVRALSGDNPPIRLYPIYGPWPDDPWGRALLDMRASPASDGTQWTDTTRYDLAGWQGADSRTGSNLFVVTAYRKANVAPRQTFRGAPTPAPPYTPPAASVPQVPYYPQYPTGPIAWPPQSSTGPAPYEHATDNADSAAMPYYAQGFSTSTGPLTGPVSTIATPEPTPENNTLYYIGFPSRIMAGLIDLVCIALIEIGLLFLYMSAMGYPDFNDFGSFISDYWGFFCVSLVIFVAYYVLQWTFWGKTLGKSIVGIKVVDHAGRKPQFGRSLLRVMGYFFPGGFLLIGFDPRNQALHDKVAETYVVPKKPPNRVPAGLPGYGSPTLERVTGPGLSELSVGPALGLANVASTQSYEVVEFASEEPERSGQESIYREIASLDGSLNTVAVLPDLPDVSTGELADTRTSSPDIRGERATGALNEQMLRQHSDRASSVERAREQFRQGMDLMEQGVRQSERGYKVEPSIAYKAAQALAGSADLVPNSVVYRYFLGVALRYSEGFEMAIREFRQVLDLDPSHYEARQQVAYGQRWHDAFAYPPWSRTPSAEPGMAVPEPILELLPSNNQPVTRLVLLREGNSKVVSVLSRTPRNSWAVPLTADLPAHIDMVLSRTPHGPVIAFYVVVEDRPGDPYKGETFLNPHDPGSPTYDACQLGQNMLAQLARQDHTYLIFVDEENRLLLSRRLDFGPQVQVNINRCLYEVQTLPAQIMDPHRFQHAAEWHMEHFALDQVK